MSRRGRAAKRRVRYDGNPPRCKNCQHWRKPVRGLRDSLPVMLTPPMCSKHTFVAEAGGVCDTWEGLDGSTVE